MQKSFYQAIRDIRSGKLGNVYLLYHATDGYPIKWLSEELVAAMGHQGMDHAEIARFSLADRTIEEVITEAGGGNLFANYVVPICDDFDFVTTSFKGKTEVASAALWLLDHLPETPVILTSTGEKLDERRKITKAFTASQDAVVIDASKHSSDEYKSMLRESIGGDLALTSDQVAYLMQGERTLGQLRLEADKVRTYAWNRTSISDEELHQLVHTESDADLFAIVAMIVRGDIGQAYGVLQELVAGDVTFGLIALLSRQYRLIARVRTEANKGYSDAQLAAMLSVHPYACKVAREQGRQVSDEQCEKRIVELARLEYDIKSGRLSEKTALDLWFMRQMAASEGKGA